MKKIALANKRWLEKKPRPKPSLRHVWRNASKKSKVKEIDI